MSLPEYIDLDYLYNLTDEEEVFDENEEYYLLLMIFLRSLNSETAKESWATFEELALTRSFHLFKRVLQGFNLTLDEGREILQRYSKAKHKNNTSLEYLVKAALENLVEFAIAEEYQVFNSLPERLKKDDNEEYLKVFKRYNHHYARQENEDVLYSSEVAKLWMYLPGEDLITYNTQRDERVRDLHLSFDGLSYPKNLFPPELIPPIDFGCRCYLTSDTSGLIEAKLDIDKKEKPTINPVFSESLALGGKIFSVQHPYFNIPEPQKAKLIKMKTKILNLFMKYDKKNNLR